jgi:cell division protein FtsQ
MSPTRTPTRARPAPSKAPRRSVPMDPRIRQRRVAVTRNAGRRRLRVLLGLLVLSTLLVLGWFVAHSALFSARVVTISGETHTSAAQIAAAADLGARPPLLDINTAEVAGRVDQLAWVKSATVSLQWPDGVLIHVTERQPVALIARSGGGFAEVDRTGRVLQVTTVAPSGLVRVEEPALPGAPGSTLGAAADSALRVAATLPASFVAQVVAVQDAGQGDIHLVLTTPVTVDLGTASQLAAKYEDVTSMLVSATLHAGDVLNVSVPDAPTVTGP